MNSRTARAWIGFVLLALGCRGERIVSILSPPPPPPPPGTTPQLAFRLGGSAADQVTGVVVDPTGNVYVAGTFTGTVDFDPGNGVGALTSLGGVDGFLARYTAVGALVWAVRAGGTGNDTVTALARDAAGNLFLAGGFEGIATFGLGAGVPALVSQGGRDGFVAKFGADGTVVWARRFGGPQSEDVTDVALDAGGNLYAVGSFAERADALPAAGGAIVSFGASDGFVVSFDGAGAVRWAFAVGGTDADSAAAVRVTSAGGVVVAGTFRGIADFAPGAAVTSLTATGGSDVFLAGYSTGGTLLWAKRIGGLLDEDVAPGGLAADPIGGVALTGAFSGSVDFDPGPALVVRTSIGTTDTYVARFDGTGTFASAFSVGGTGTERANHLAFGSDGNLVVTGAFAGSVDFDPGSGSLVLTNLGGSGGTDVFTAKYTPAGALLWVSRFGDAANGAGNRNAGLAVATDGSGAVFVGGIFFATPDFDPGTGSFGLTSLGDADGFVVQLTPAGALASR
ncbi:MAG TPA: SBBP repeat-containing protein [Gemmatimonadales bacterium]|jgi:hypothetical protein|nr:SBBP repeat-containing protein [Gemmatimonadales bacterium]